MCRISNYASYLMNSVRKEDIKCPKLSVKTFDAFQNTQESIGLFKPNSYSRSDHLVSEGKLRRNIHVVVRGQQT